MIFIIEPSPDAATEFGHSRAGVRYLINYINLKSKCQDDIEVLINNSINFDVPNAKNVLANNLNLKKKSFFWVPIFFLLSFFYFFRIFSVEKSLRNIPKIIRAHLSRFNTNIQYKNLGVKNASEIIFQDYSFQSMPSRRVLRSHQIIRLRIISKPPLFLEKQWIKQMNILIKKFGTNIILSTENIKVNKWASENLKIKVHHVPWFSHLNQNYSFPEYNSTPKTLRLVFPGSQRISKGLLTLPELVKTLNDNFDIRIYLQNSNLITPAIKLCYEQLSKFHNVTILPEIITDVEYFQLLKDSDVGVLPYSDEGYIWTASGIMIDLISSGCLACAPESSAVGEELAYFGLGLAYKDVADLCASLREYFIQNNLITREVNTLKYFQTAKTETDAWLFGKPAKHKE